jgi:glycosyltransferase involved in cell wall biosynthesis
MGLDKRILIVTSGQPSLNPRLVKEANALTTAGYNVTVIYQYWNHWGTEMDKALLTKKSWKAIRVGGSPNNDKFTYWYSRLIHKKNQLFSKYFPNLLTEFSIFRCTKLLLKEAVKYKANLYIAHNLGALPAAVKAAKKNNAKCGFDAEDFHRQEVTDNPNENAYKLAKFMEDKYLPQVDYLTTASPLIANAYQKLYPNLKPIVINNVFSSSFLQQVNHANHNKELGLFWFSQTIGKGRGIEDALKAIALLKKPYINLTLLGNIDKNNQNYFFNLANELGLAKNQLSLISPVSPDHIFELASKYDIGLALEH